MRFKTFVITLIMLLISVQSFAQENLQEMALTLSEQLKQQKIAVAGFSCVNAYSLTASSIIQERLTTFMANDKNLAVLERNKLDTILKEQELQLSGAVDADTAKVTGKLLAVDVIITGTFVYITNNEIEVYARALDVKTGKILSSCKAIIKKDWQDNEIINKEAASSIPQKAAEYFKTGVDYYSQGKYSMAIELFNRVIAQNPEFADAYLYRGIAYYKKGKYDYALLDLNKAIETNPELAEAYYQRAILYKFVKAEYESAMDDFDKAIELNPNVSSYYTERGELYVFEKEYDKAFADCNKAIMLDSKAADAYAWRGHIYYSIKRDNNKAIKDYSKAIEIRPQLIGYWISRAEVYFDMGEYKKAINDCNKAIEIDPDHAAEAFVLRDIIYKTINKKH